MPREWKSGAPILYRGASWRSRCSPRARTAIAADLFHLTVLPSRARTTSARSPTLVGHWLKDQALDARRAARRATTRARHGARRRRCGSPTRAANGAAATRKGEIRLNWRLVQLPPALADYVVAHEVAHLVELNHSARFWALVEALLPGHAALRRAARRVDGAARQLERRVRRRPAPAAAAAVTVDAAPAPSAARASAAPSSSPPRVSRQRPSLRTEVEAAARAPRPRSRDSARGG